MKSVRFSEIVRVHDRSRLLSPARSSRLLAYFALTLALGLPSIIGAFHLLDPGAPLAYIVLPVLAGGLMPAFAVLPGRFEVTTRFDARHLVGTLDETLGALGYAAAEKRPGAVRYRTRNPGVAGWMAPEVAVMVREHAIEVIGPVATLRALRKQMSC